MRILKERKVNEAQKIDFYALLSDAFPDDQKSQKDVYDVKNVVYTSIKDIYSGNPSPAELYFSLTTRFNSMMDKIAADYITGNKDYTQEINIFIDDLSNALKQTEKITKDMISKLQSLNKSLLNLPKKE